MLERRRGKKIRQLRHHRDPHPLWPSPRLGTPVQPEQGWLVKMSHHFRQFLTAISLHDFDLGIVPKPFFGFFGKRKIELDRRSASKSSRKAASMSPKKVPVSTNTRNRRLLAWLMINWAFTSNGAGRLTRPAPLPKRNITKQWLQRRVDGRRPQEIFNL